MRRKGWLSRVQDIAANLPGAEVAAEVYSSLESLALQELKARLDRLEGGTGLLPSDTAHSLAGRVNPSRILSTLLEEAAEQNADDARRSLYTSILLQLTPDEACMLATLSDGEAHALIHLVSGNPLGGTSRVASNISSIAKVAPIKLRECGAAYVERLRNLGLAETRPENKQLEIKYQILEGDLQVQNLIKDLKTQGRQVRFQRRTLQLSNLGRELWEYCDPNNDAS